jgi:AcrR family transcriptional regulator
MSRPRSSEAHRKVLRAALDLFCERGIEPTSMDSIARASGVSKATIYNHWPHKEALLLEVVEMIHGLNRPPQHFDSGDLLTDLTWILTRKPPGEFETERARFTGSSARSGAVAPWSRHAGPSPRRFAEQRIVACSPRTSIST